MCTQEAIAALDTTVLDHAIRIVGDCAVAARACADWCLAEALLGDRADLSASLRAITDCADTCDLTQRLIGRHSADSDSLLIAQMLACAIGCEIGEAACQSHDDAMLQDYARIARSAAEACRTAVTALRGDWTEL